MLKKRCYRKIGVTTVVLFSFFLWNLFSNHPDGAVQELVYINSYPTQVVYLLDQYERVARTKVYLQDAVKIEEKAKKMLLILIQEGEGEARLPSGFRGIIPSDTKILGISYQNSILKVNFSKELLEIDQSLEEKMIEAIVYTLTEIEEVNQVILYVEDQILTKLPKSKINLPSTLDRSFGINKEYHLTTYQNVNAVTVYYVSKYNEEYYYVPVTKYMNDTREKIKIIIEELSSSPVSETNLMSFLNGNTKLLLAQEEVDTLFLVFNEYLFTDMDTKNILEEVLYSIRLSIADNYDVKEVVFQFEDDEIYKTTIKTLE